MKVKVKVKVTWAPRSSRAGPMNEPQELERGEAAGLDVAGLLPSMYPPGWVTSVALVGNVLCGLSIICLCASGLAFLAAAALLNNVLGTISMAMLTLGCLFGLLSGPFWAIVAIRWHPRFKFSLRTLTLFVLLLTCCGGLLAFLARETGGARLYVALGVSCAVGVAFLVSIAADGARLGELLRQRRQAELTGFGQPPSGE